MALNLYECNCSSQCSCSPLLLKVPCLLRASSPIFCTYNSSSSSDSTCSGGEVLAGGNFFIRHVLLAVRFAVGVGIHHFTILALLMGHFPNT